MSIKGKKLILAVSGSIAAYKSAELLRLLVKKGAEVQPVMTPGATRFLEPLTLSTLAKRETLVSIFPEEGQADPVWTKHVDLGLWADGVIIAPATANTIARLANGACSTMLEAIVLSARCPVMVAPAMDHDMWRHPATRRNVETLRHDGATVVSPEHGELASGLVGDGRLPEPEDLLQAIDTWFASHAPGAMEGLSVLVTAGPTREAIDPVRFLSNGSTGTMGFALAAEAARRGADVTLVTGPAALETPSDVRRIDVVSADDLYEAALEHGDVDLVIAAAAVADYAPEEASEQKLKKGDGKRSLALRRTPDTLASLGREKREGQTLVGFALETHDALDNARQKLESKNLDWIVLNHANEDGSGFGAGTNRVTILGGDGQQVNLERALKTEIAAGILDVVMPQ